MTMLTRSERGTGEGERQAKRKIGCTRKYFENGTNSYDLLCPTMSREVLLYMRLVLRLRGVDMNRTDSDFALSNQASGERDGERVSST
jgi:hypothetical protein